MQQNWMLGRKAMVGVTRELARYSVASRFEDLPEAVRHEGERAFVNILGIEIQLRVGNILVTPPAHCPVGVSTQSILGVIGAAVASAKLLRLAEQQMVWAIGLATAQAAGHRETHATMSSHFVPANAARAGLSPPCVPRTTTRPARRRPEAPKGSPATLPTSPISPLPRPGPA